MTRQVSDELVQYLTPRMKNLVLYPEKSEIFDIAYMGDKAEGLSGIEAYRHYFYRFNKYTMTDLDRLLLSCAISDNDIDLVSKTDFMTRYGIIHDEDLLNFIRDNIISYKQNFDSLDKVNCFFLRWSIEEDKPYYVILDKESAENDSVGTPAMPKKCDRSILFSIFSICNLDSGILIESKIFPQEVCIEAILHRVVLGELMSIKPLIDFIAVCDDLYFVSRRVSNEMDKHYTIIDIYSDRSNKLFRFYYLNNTYSHFSESNVHMGDRVRYIS